MSKKKFSVGEKFPHSLALDSNEFFENSTWLNTKEAASYLRTTPDVVRKWVYQGRLQAYKLFERSLRFKRCDLDTLIKGGRYGNN